MVSAQKAKRVARRTEGLLGARHVCQVPGLRGDKGRLCPQNLWSEELGLVCKLDEVPGRTREHVLSGQSSCSRVSPMLALRK